LRHGGARRGGRAEGGDWKPLPDRRDGYEVEVAPRRRKERRAEGGDQWRDTVYLSGRTACTRRMRKRGDNDGRSRVSR
jgi:hypothetical protein